MTSATDLLLSVARPRSFRQERARRTYERLIEAATSVFAASGFDATQTPDIAAQAGVSVGTFYRYFSDKREIFDEVHRRFLARAFEDVLARLSPESFIGFGMRSAIDRVLSVLADYAAFEPELQLVFHQMVLRDAEVAALRRRFDDVAHKQLTQLIELAAPHVEDPAATAHVIQTAAVELAVGLADVRGPVPVSKERSLAALARLIERALLPEPKR